MENKERCGGLPAEVEPIDEAAGEGKLPHPLLCDLNRVRNATPLQEAGVVIVQSVGCPRVAVSGLADPTRVGDYSVQPNLDAVAGTRHASHDLSTGDGLDVEGGHVGVAAN